ncbi:hypothetical protein [Rhodococcus sp. Q]|uniref:hypothetical protein n=1 Tax=Rhodococcus sp. Q TaxID=2502252 RepID=UPI002016A2D5|nr:hypothetical protein [Rhodococcus sp. Q]
MSDNWSALSVAVDNGDLLIERGVAQNCARHCTDLLVKLVDVQQRARALGDLKGMGTFPSGIALARKFSLKAVGGDYSMVQALTDHISEVEAMRDVFLRIEAQYVATDERGAQALAAIDPEVGG